MNKSNYRGDKKNEIFRKSFNNINRLKNVFSYN